MSYLQASPGTGGGGGGGPVTSLTGTPTQFAYFDLAGNGTGDSLATRDSVTNLTFIGRDVTADVTQGFELTNTLFGGLSGAVAIASDSSTGTSAYTGVVDLSGVGQSSTTSVMAATDGVTFQTASISKDEFRVSVAATGNTAVSQFMAKKTEIDSSFQTSAGLRSRFFGNATEAYMRHQGLTDDLRVGADTGIYLYKNGSKMYFPSSITAPASGYVLTSTGTGTSDWQLPTTSLTQDYIGFGNSSNQMTGLSAFKYVNSNNQFLQTIPNNTGNAGATTSPLAFGAPSYSGTGINDLTLTWNSAIYESNKYGGNLSISISSLGTPDKFSWTFTGGYGQVIGSDTDVAILPGLAQELFDTQGRLIAEVTFAGGTGHNTDDSWTAVTSLGTYTWGQLLTDGTHNFMYARPVTGSYYGGDAQYLLSLGGNGNRYAIEDASGEWNIFASRMFYVRTPAGGDKVIEADLTTLEFKAGDTTGTKYFHVDVPNSLFNVNGGIIRGDSFHNNGTVAQGDATQQDVRSGTYTPTLTNVTNISSSTAYKFQWMRVGNVITVSGQVDITNTATGASELGISLPIASNLANTTDCVGSAPGGSSGILDDVGWVSGDTTNDRASMQSTATNTNPHSHWVSFTYEVI